MKTQNVYVAWSNSDLTEGRGWEIPLYICQLQSTAVRLGKKKYVQGGDCPVTKEEIIYHNGRWLGPCVVEMPDKEDKLKQEAAETKEKVLVRARILGLTEDEIRVLSKP